MSRNYFRVFGALTLLLGPALFLPSFHRAPTPWQWFRVFVLISTIEMVGFGLVLQRRWAAFYFSAPLFCFGIHKAFISIYAVAFPFNLLTMLHGLSLTLPLVLTIRLWPQLIWGRKFF